MRRIGKTEGERCGGSPSPPEYKMIKVPTADLGGHALDYAAALAVAQPGQRVNLWIGSSLMQVQLESSPGSGNFYSYSPSHDLVATGHLIENERISLIDHECGVWAARAWNGAGEPDVYGFGQNHMIAVARCVVRRRFGESIEIPEPLLPMTSLYYRDLPEGWC